METSKIKINLKTGIQEFIPGITTNVTVVKKTEKNRTGNHGKTSGVLLLLQQLSWKLSKHNRLKHQLVPKKKRKDFYVNAVVENPGKFILVLRLT